MAKVAFSPATQADLDETAAYMENVLRNPSAARSVRDVRFFTYRRELLQSANV